MKFYRLDNSNYIDSKQSYWLDKITPEFLVKYVNRGLIESPLSIEADFMADLDSHRLLRPKRTETARTVGRNQ